MYRRIIITLVVALGVLVTVAASAASSEQYMAVCTETQEHGGQEYVLTSWLNSREAANEAGKAHEQATRGHRWTIKTRQRPQSSATSLTTPGNTLQSFASGAMTVTAACEGNACDVVSVTWDQSQQKYLVQNRSDRRVKVELRNWATTNTIPLGPNESKYAFVTAYINPYRAYYE